MKRNHIILGGIAAAVLIGMSAGAGAYLLVKHNDTPEPVKVAATQNKRVGDNIRWDNKQPPPDVPPPSAQRVASNCNDGNIVGTAIGGVGGGIAGSQFGKGDGKTAAAIGGAVVGGYLGNQFIPTHNALCP